MVPAKGQMPLLLLIKHGKWRNILNTCKVSFQHEGEEKKSLTIHLFLPIFCSALNPLYFT